MRKVSENRPTSPVLHDCLMKSLVVAFVSNNHCTARTAQKVKRFVRSELYRAEPIKNRHD